MNADNILQVLKIKKIEHDIKNCRKLKDSDIEFIKTLDKKSILELLFLYDDTIQFVTELFCDLNDQE